MNINKEMWNILSEDQQKQLADKLFNKLNKAVNDLELNMESNFDNVIEYIMEDHLDYIQIGEAITKLVLDKFRK